MGAAFGVAVLLVLALTVVFVMMALGTVIATACVVAL